MMNTSRRLKGTPESQAPDDGIENQCHWEGCTGAGIHRAPTDRSLSKYYLFCLEHVRTYNARWNYHEGLSPDYIVQEYRSSATWDRPTWKIGERQTTGRAWQDLFDPLNVFPQGFDSNNKQTSTSGAQDCDTTNALNILGLKD